MAREECRHEDHMPLPGGRWLVSRCFRELGHDGNHAMPVQRALLRWTSNHVASHAPHNVVETGYPATEPRRD